MPLPGLHRLQPCVSASSDKGGRNSGQHAADATQSDLLRRSDGRSARRDSRGAAWEFRAEQGGSLSTVQLPNQIAIPAKAGIYVFSNSSVEGWVPAFAGTAVQGKRR